MTSETEKELLLRVAERIGDEKFFPKGFHNPYSLFSFTQDDARIISRVLREAAAEGWRPIETAPAEGRFLVPSEHDRSVLCTVIRFRHPDFVNCVFEERTDRHWYPKWWMPCPDLPPPPSEAATLSQETRNDD